MGSWLKDCELIGGEVSVDMICLVRYVCRKAKKYFFL